MAGRPYKEININVKEFIAMIKFIKDHPVDKTCRVTEEGVPIPDTGKVYWKAALDQVLECLNYIQWGTPLTSAKKVMHEKKISRYSDNRFVIYEYIRTQIMEKHGAGGEEYGNEGRS